MDTNGNHQIGYHEALVAFAKFNLLAWEDNYKHELKLKQLNCSACLYQGNTSVYYM